MLNPLHYVHLVFHLLVENAVFHEFPFIQLLGRIWDAVVLVRNFVHRGKRALSNLAQSVVLLRAVPCLVQALSVVFGRLREIEPRGRERSGLCFLKLSGEEVDLEF